MDIPRSNSNKENVIIEEEDEEDNNLEDANKLAAVDFFEEETEDAKTVAKDVPTFHSLHLSRPLLRSVTEMGFVIPTPIQARCIPKILAGRDMCAGAQTGSGKTAGLCMFYSVVMTVTILISNAILMYVCNIAAFMLPTLERLLFRSRRLNASRVLAITPTRELATQCHQMTSKLMQYTDIT